MSRLDDELKIAFRRQEPSPDFAARLLERINSTPEPRPSFWQRLAAVFAMPRFRWAAIGATAAVLIAIGAVQYGRLHQTTIQESGKMVAANSATNANVSAWAESKPRVETIKRPGSTAHEPRKSRAHVVAVRKEPRPSPEAEAAKERVLFALQVAGATFNDAQRAIQDDGPKDKPEPLNNR